MIVLDCDAAVAIARKTVEGNALRGLMLKDEEVVSPDLFISEATSAIAKYVKAGFMSVDLANDYLENIIGLVDEYVDMRINYIEAFDEGIRHNHSVYDMYYLTLARRNGATLFTLDRRLIALCEELKIDCVHAVSLEA